MLNNFIGTQYRLADNWFNNIDINNFKDKQINYLEIGTFYGANILSVAKSYGLHNDSKLYCIDPWEDYNDYPEYKNQQSTIYTFELFKWNKIHSKKTKLGLFVPL